MLKKCKLGFVYNEQVNTFVYTGFSHWGALQA